MPPKRLYHLTIRNQLASILELGLVPSIGPRSRALEEEEPLVYLFGELADVEQALMGWAADAFEDEDPLCVLELDFDPTWGPSKLQRDACQFEWTSKAPIPPSQISRIFDENLKVISERARGPVAQTVPARPKPAP